MGLWDCMMGEQVRPEFLSRNPTESRDHNWDGHGIIIIITVQIKLCSFGWKMHLFRILIYTCKYISQLLEFPPEKIQIKYCNTERNCRKGALRKEARL